MTYKYFFQKGVLIFCLICLTKLCIAQGKLEIQSGSFFKTEGAAYINYSDTRLVNDGELQSGTGFVTFKNNNNQPADISGTAATSFYKLIVDMAGDDLVLNNNIGVDHSLIFQSGNLELNNQLVTLSPLALLIQEEENRQATGLIGGELSISTELNVPVFQDPGNLGMRIFTTIDDLGLITINRGHSPQDVGIGTGIARWFNISSPNNLETEVSLLFNYFDTELQGIPECELGFWVLENGIPVFMGSDFRDEQDNWVLLNKVNPFSLWTLAPSPPSAICQDITITLDQSGEALIDPTDIDNGSYDACGIQEMSLDKKFFTYNDIGNNLVTLSVTDINGYTSSCTAIVTVLLPPGISITSDGNDIIEAEAINQLAGILPDSSLNNTGLDIQTKTPPGIIDIFPNPVSETLFVRLKDFPKGEVVLNVFDLSGKIMLSKHIEVLGKMAVINPFDTRNLHQGTYFIQVVSESDVSKSLKFVKMN